MMDAASAAYVVDGEVVVIDAENGEGSRVDLGGPEDTAYGVLPGIGSDSSLALSPNGRFLMVSSGDPDLVVGSPGEWLWMINVATGTVTLQTSLELAPAPDDLPGLLNRMAWSPNGSEFACVCAFARGRPALYVMQTSELDAGDLLFNSGESPGVTPRQISWGTDGLVAELAGLEPSWRLVPLGGESAPNPEKWPPVESLADLYPGVLDELGVTALTMGHSDVGGFLTRMRGGSLWLEWASGERTVAGNLGARPILGALGDSYYVVFTDWKGEPLGEVTRVDVEGESTLTMLPSGATTISLAADLLSSPQPEPTPTAAPDDSGVLTLPQASSLPGWDEVPFFAAAAAYASEGQMVIVGPDGTAALPGIEMSDQDTLLLSPDGRRLLLVRANEGEMDLLYLTSQSVRPLDVPVDGDSTAPVAWAGNEQLFCLCGDLRDDGYRAPVFVEVPDAGPVAVTSSPNNLDKPGAPGVDAVEFGSAGAAVRVAEPAGATTVGWYTAMSGEPWTDWAETRWTADRLLLDPVVVLVQEALPSRLVFQELGTFETLGELSLEGIREPEVFGVPRSDATAVVVGTDEGAALTLVDETGQRIQTLARFSDPHHSLSVSERWLAQVN